jgi:hypothetical protein
MSDISLRLSDDLCAFGTVSQKSLGVRAAVWDRTLRNDTNKGTVSVILDQQHPCRLCNLVSLA